MKRFYDLWKEGMLVAAIIFLLVAAVNGQAATTHPKKVAAVPPPASNSATTPSATPQPSPAIAAAPTINARGYILMDANTGDILAQKNIDQRMAPASLTKIMTIYIIAEALRNGHIHLDDKVTVSKDAWRTGGSRMFIQVGTQVPAQQLIDGIVIVSGNDAAVAIAEHIGGNVQAFVDLMNQTAAKLGLTNTHFSDVNGLPSPSHYTSPRDLAILSRDLINNFPDYYGQWFAQKWFTYNNIRQPNRNHLLWRDASVDGLKTGFTSDAGYCLVASARRNNMRLISVVMGSPSNRERTSDSQALLNWGFRFYETHKLYAANQPLLEPRVWMGNRRFASLGVNKDIYVTIPAGQYADLKAALTLNNNLQAPIFKGKPYGSVDISLQDKPLLSAPLIALEDNPRGNIIFRARDHLIHFLNRWFKNEQPDQQA
ncbi:MAG: D-alanyl-D-alanine carboxypeptidase family protein [Gammaproteobacteria bacterium]